MYDWTVSVQYKRTVSVAYIDFFKAFNIRRCFVSRDRYLLVKAFTFLGIIPLTGHLRYCKTLYALSMYNVAASILKNVTAFGKSQQKYEVNIFDEKLFHSKVYADIRKGSPKFY